MGCDIHIVAQKLEGERWVNVSGKFHEGPRPFDWRSYGMFGFLAGVRNYSDIPSIAECRGLPSGIDPEEYGDEGIWLGDHSYSWLSVAELSAFDYEQPVEDRRVTRQIASGIWSGGQTCDPGDGEMTTYREFLGPAFFDDLRELQRIGAERVVFGFDS